MSQHVSTAARPQDAAEGSEATPGLTGTRSAPRDFPSHSSRPRHEGTAEAPRGGSGSYGSSRQHMQGHHHSSSPSDRSFRKSGSDDSRQQHQHAHHGPRPSSQAYGSSPGTQHRSPGGGGNPRYGQWPPQSSSPAEGGLHRAGSSSGRVSSHRGHGGLHRSGSSSGKSGGRTFNWPAYMDRSQLQQAMKRGQVFRWAHTGCSNEPARPGFDHYGTHVRLHGCKWCCCRLLPLTCMQGGCSHHAA